MKEKNWGMDLNIEDTTLYTPHYADDQVVIAQEREYPEFYGRKLLG